MAAAHEPPPSPGLICTPMAFEVLRAGASLKDTSIAQLISRDSKEFAMAGAKVEIAQVNAIDLDEVLSWQAELETALQDIVSAKDLDLFLFVVTDILNSDLSASRSARGRRRWNRPSGSSRGQPRTPERRRVAQAADRPRTDRAAELVEGTGPRMPIAIDRTSARDLGPNSMTPRNRLQ